VYVQLYKWHCSFALLLAAQHCGEQVLSGEMSILKEPRFLVFLVTLQVSSPQALSSQAKRRPK
jgi:hypothetical protein